MKILLLAITVSLSLTQFFQVQAQPAATVAPPTTDDIRFCGEKLPSYLPTVAQRWQKTVTRRARYTDDLLDIQRKAAVLFPIIEPILEQNAIPKDLKYLALVESELKSQSISRKGAAGLWQLMPKTARKLGLTVRRRHDDRYDVRKATQAACRYMWELYRQTGSWMLAASAYNAGPTYIAQLSKQFSPEHPLMLPFAKAETQLYVYQALAYKELLTRPQNYSDLLSDRVILALAKGNHGISATDRQAILAVIEKPHPETESENVPDEMEEASLANATVVVAGLETAETVQLRDVRPVALTEAKSTPVSPAVARHWPSVQTRSITNNTLTEGQLFVFEVTSPQTIDEVKLAVGDMVYAHVEIIDKSSGRVYLRADRVMSSQTRETKPLRLVAVEKSRQPGVPLPVRDVLATGWQLAWEKI
ncbi:lytic transglycosylase domain-containing protein [uncultured Fibrella sp.]|uniref:lytic transglycosylase domain-containing protein n=1 Tax=uncultured Fibrella sp. TaxID=1284596 RepID=UPI0035CA897A